MRMISRRENEGVVIGDDVFVTVLDIHEDHVRLAISSPNIFPPYREETLYWVAGERRELQQTFAPKSADLWSQLCDGVAPQSGNSAFLR
jgi:carbon storage regulator CsrA